MVCDVHIHPALCHRSIVGVVSIMSSNTEVAVVRNEASSYGVLQCRGGVVDAIEHYNSGSTFWLTNDFLTAGP